MDDTVLQTHRVDPRQTQVILLANGTVYFCLKKKNNFI